MEGLLTLCHILLHGNMASTKYTADSIILKTLNKQELPTSAKPFIAMTESIEQVFTKTKATRKSDKKQILTTLEFIPHSPLSKKGPQRKERKTN